MPWTVVLEKTPESPLDSKEIKPVNPKGNQSWIFIGRNDALAEAPILWPPDVKNWLIEKDLDAGKDWSQEEKGSTEDEMVGWHHWLYGHEFEWAPGVGDGQGSLACCSPWDHKESDMTEQMNWTELKSSVVIKPLPAVHEPQETQIWSPRSGRSPGEGNGRRHSHSSIRLENPMDRRAWWATVHGVAKSWTWLRD